MDSGLFEMLPKKIFVYKLYIFYMYKLDLALNNLQGLICHKTQLTKPTPLLISGCGTRLIFKQSKTGLNSVFLLDWLPNPS